MLAEVLGFTLTRTIPTKVLFGVLTGAFQVYGGVVRNSNGQIIAHLINSVNPLSLTTPLDSGIGAINTYQLHRVGKNVSDVKKAVDGIGEQVNASVMATNHLVGLANGTMLLSGLTLAVSTAGFAFLNRKLNKIDEKLQHLQKDVREIKDFLNTRQRAELTTALNTLRDVSDAPSDETRRQLLVHSRQTLGTLHHHYKSQFVAAAGDGVLTASEEYFTVTAIAHALCAGELDMYDTAASDLEESFTCWSATCREIAKKAIFRDDPSRFLSHYYANEIRADELVDWLEFAHEDERGLAWIDELRKKRIDPWYAPWKTPSLSNSERLELEILRRLASRYRILESYRAQYQYLRQHKVRPSAYQRQIDKLDRSQTVQETYVLVANEVAESLAAA